MAKTRIIFRLISFLMKLQIEAGLVSGKSGKPLIGVKLHEEN